MSVWQFLPGATKMGMFFISGDTWVETEEAWSLDELCQRLQKAIDYVFDYYKSEDMFGYLQAGYEQYLKGDSLFHLSAFNPPEEKVQKAKMLIEEIQQREEHLNGLKKEYEGLFRDIDRS